MEDLTLFLVFIFLLPAITCVIPCLAIICARIYLWIKQPPQQQPRSEQDTNPIVVMDTSSTNTTPLCNTSPSCPVETDYPPPPYNTFPGEPIVPSCPDENPTCSV